MNALLIQIMREYVSQLINLLVEAGNVTLTSPENATIKK